MNDLNLSTHIAAMQARQAEMAAEAARIALIRQAYPTRPSVLRRLHLVWSTRREAGASAAPQLASAWQRANAAPSAQ
jgi:hypothetical protein